MRPHAVIALLLLGFSLLATPASPQPHKQRTSISRDPGIYPGGRKADKTGWRMLPDVPGAEVDAGSIAMGNATLTAYVSSGRDAKRVKRAVVQIHGVNRDSWNQWMYADLSLQRATAIDPSDVLIVAPQFFTSRDYGAYDASMGGSPTSSQLIWDDEEWAEGVDAVNPPDARVGAFDALDATLDYLLNRERFPELVTVVVAGFSLGAQLVHRYSILRPLKPEQDARVNYWIAAPNSFLYLNSTRPLSVRDCPEWNAYKHGLEGLVPGYVARTNQSRAVDLTQERLAARVLARKTSYAVGLEDHAAGSGDCASRAQGRTHLTKMTYWIEDALPFIPGSTQTTAALPAHHRVDWIEGVDHADYRVIQSDAGVRALFLEDFSERGRDAKAPKSNGLKSGKRRAGGDEDGEGNAARRSHPRASSCVAVVAALLSTGVVAVMA